MLRVRISVSIEAIPLSANDGQYVTGSLYLGGMLDREVSTLAEAVGVVEELRSLVGEDPVDPPGAQT